MSNNVNNVPKEKCTGCSACLNLCPVDAISMQPDHEGFLMPVVDESKCVNCGKCVNQCPAIHTEYKNEANPKLYAARANDEIRAKSSSGGVFTLLAEEILGRGGCVCGAAFDENMILSHIIVDNKEDLEKLKGSKYVQSSIGNSYRGVKEVLDSGREMLFTGTPCQVAGLYAYLGKEYNNLYTMDLVCHGVPSQKIFSQYLDELRGKRNIKNVQFRDKSNGWRADLLTVTYENNSKYIGVTPSEPNLTGETIPELDGDTYEIGFQKNVFLRRSCADCQFCQFPRQGDISVGDFWGINRIDPSLNDKKGTSMVFVNNAHGRDLFSVILPRFMDSREMNVPFEQITNRIRPHYPQHPHRERFFELMDKGETLKDAVSDVYKQKYDIGIVGIYTCPNFGGALTYYALFHTVQDMGYKVLMIERPMGSKEGPGGPRIYINDPYRNYEKAKFYSTKEEMHELNDHCDTFLVGSDQLFNNVLYNLFGKWVTLDWVDDRRKKVAYAASFGHDKIWHPDHIRAEMSFFMQKFDAFSVREESGVEICDKYFGVDATWVLDPVFLCDQKHYEALVAQSTIQYPEHYLGAYILDLSKRKENIVKRVCKHFSLEPQVYSEMLFEELPKNGWTMPILPSTLINDRMKNIANSDFFIADSFHGVCFAILFKKNFIAILNRKRGASRFYSILSRLGLMDRIVETEQDVIDHPEVLEPIDYDKVYEKLAVEKDRCIKWLADALAEKGLKSYSDYDLWKRIAEEQRLKLEVLNKQNAVLQNEVAILHDAIIDLINIPSRYQGYISDKMQLRAITDIYDYMTKLQELKNNYLVVMTIRDNVGLSINDRITRLANRLGFKQPFDALPKLTSYIGVINKGKVMFNIATDNAATVLSERVDDVQIDAFSKLFKQGNSTSIKINGIERAVNHRGFNFVVYHKESGQIIDSVAFDTHIPSLDCIRKN